MLVRLIPVVLIATVLAGCAGQAPSVPRAESPLPPGAVPAASAAAADPVGLIGLWQLSAAGEAGDAVLRVDGEQQIMLFRRCLSLTGGWQATVEGQFLAHFDGYSPNTRGPACPGVEEPDASAITPGWLTRATAFRAEGTERLLLDDGGATVARLLPGGKAAPRADMAPELTEPPVVTAETRERLAVAAAALPGSLEPATSAALLGRWRPEGRDVGAFAEFRAGGVWEGNDGCNGQGGRWSAGPDGSMLAVTGPSTLIGCENVPVAAWLARARRAGFDGEVLVLLDAEGRELGRLTR
jgi:hypothetical protein